MMLHVLLYALLPILAAAFNPHSLSDLGSTSQSGFSPNGDPLSSTTDVGINHNVKIVNRFSPFMKPVSQAAGARQADPGIISLSASTAAQILVATVQVGTPPQDYVVHFDTGSAAFWLRSSACTSQNTCDKPGQASFTPSKSSTFSANVNVTSTTLTYADGTKISCQVGNDTLSIGGIGLPNQPICLASSIVSQTPLHDGIIGLAPPGVYEETSVFSKLEATHAFANSQISFWYNQSDVGDGQILSGVVTVGGVDPDLSIGKVNWFPATLSNRKHWSIPLTNITLKDGSKIVPPAPNFFTPPLMVIDSGSTFSYLPPAMFRALNAVHFQARDADGTGTYVIDCNATSRLAPITVTLADVDIVIPPEEQYIKFRQFCIILFTTVERANPTPLLGVSFMRYRYTVFDHQGMRIGFSAASLGDGSRPAAPTSGGSGGGLGGPAARSKSGGIRTGHRSNLMIWVSVAAASAVALPWMF
ncbi:hypothetical protein BASA50_007581 [Batrachochytrium salamandrivorans]|uniref:Peptidase A1 domain-containing protein n=1 Tax=Batrachochytrium salamandrivorans TaxID=1357716 RepID=A0ABQ8F9S8_9FUNG|nr:hypothetical protein BASA50_007581 [Batrachochytrium salamandrivorans]KAH9244138.1 hypothetical protein BASA81_018482 [Batrachochytrium salamandrivorans]KAH9269513.1 hypothetical protein BASA83_008463 [Batrachochytrium salamandrivorans]